MRSRTLTVVALPVIAAVGLGAGSATATPDSVDAAAIHYTVNRAGDSAVLSAPGARLSAADGQLLITDAGGAVAASIPLSYRMDATAYPIDLRIDGDTATLTPARANGVAVIDGVRPADVVPASKLDSVAESFNIRDQQALLALGQRAGIGSVTSAVLGAIVGGGAGCLLGAAVGATAVGVATLLTGLLPGAAIGCLVGMGTLGPIGAVGGLITVGGPILAWSAFQYFSTILSPCTGPALYCQDPATAPSAPKA
ncbi:hypothetical protein [Nocardia sp. NPDC056100]|uniref:hypothetical protein n=1 Tax=Nocardia sp. NPDC056100 TaxID=3345712 RepID=UPI0035D72F69